MEQCWYDRSLGFILAIIFSIGGLTLLLVPEFAPETVERSVITILGGIFGLLAALFFLLHVLYRRSCRSAKLKELARKTAEQH